MTNTASYQCKNSKIVSKIYIDNTLKSPTETCQENAEWTLKHALKMQWFYTKKKEKYLDWNPWQ